MNRINYYTKLIILFLWVFQTPLFAQSTRLVQVKFFDKEMQPVGQVSFSLDDSQRYQTNDKGVAVIRLSEDKLPPKNVYVYDQKSEAESWNYGKGILEIIIRERTTKSVKGVVKNALNETIPDLKVTIGKLGKWSEVTNVYGEFEVRVPADFEEKNRDAYNFDGYEIRRLEANADILRFYLSEVKLEESATVIADKSPVIKLNASPTDTIADIQQFHNFLKGITLEELNREQQQELDQVFSELVSYYQDSLRNGVQSRVTDISSTSGVSEDLENLIEQAQLEQDIATEFNRIFAEKISLINQKLSNVGVDLTAEERDDLLADIALLNKILTENENLFNESQSDYKDILKSISENILQISQLEEQLGISEQQRIEQQAIYEQRTLFYTVGLLLLALFLVVLGYFLARIKKQQNKTNAAYRQINDMNEHLEDLVAERTAMLEMTNAELDTFFYKSAHNLRGPLLTITGLSEVAKLTLDKDAQTLFTKTAETVASMDSMLKKLIMVSHINYPSDKDNIDFEKIVKDIEEEFRPLIKENNIVFTRKIDSSSFVSFPLLVDIVLRNLLENSFKFSSLANDHPEVELSIYEEEGKLFIVVSDNGMGIDTDQEDQVWRMFYVGNEDLTGNGLGLYISQKAVKTLNGTIRYSRTKDDVTQFIVTIPRIGN